MVVALCIVGMASIYSPSPEAAPLLGRARYFFGLPFLSVLPRADGRDGRAKFHVGFMYSFQCIRLREYEFRV